jgi:hypothetical protein
MLYPVPYSIQIIRRSTFDLILKVELEPSVPYDLTGKTLLAQLWDRKREEKYTDFEVTVVNAPLGSFMLKLTSAQTLLLPTLGVYDVKVIDGADEFYLIKGSFSVQEGYTDD